MTRALGNLALGPRHDLTSVRGDAREIIAPINSIGALSELDVADAIANPDTVVSRRPFLERPTICDGVDPTELEVRAYVARGHAAHVWRGLAAPTRPDLGYLAGRHLDVSNPRIVAELRATPLRLADSVVEHWPDLARVAAYFNRSPGIAIVVRSPDDGRAVDVRVRRFDPSERDAKVIGIVGGLVRIGDRLHGCYGNPHRLERDRVVVVEGLVDYLTALQLYPDADVLGAADAGSFALVAEHAARHVLSRRGVLELVPDSGNAGERAGIAAGRRAMRLGLELDRDLIFVDIGDADDLNAAYCAGWRP